MSLILEALKKLDREKPSPDRGFLVMAPVSWPASGGARPAFVGGLLVAGLAGGAAAGYWALNRTASPAVPSPPPAASAASRAPADRAPAPPAPRVSSEEREALPLPAPALRPRAGAGATPEAKAPERFQLQAISQRDGRPVAVMNDRMVQEGDTFDGVRVVRIGEAEVEIEVGGRRRVIRF